MASLNTFDGIYVLHLRGIIEHNWYDTMYHQCSLLSHYQVQLRLPKQDSNQKAYQ